MEIQKKWHEYGNEAAASANEFLNFEKIFRPQLEAKKSEYERLEGQAEKLSAKLTAATVALDTKKIAIFADLRERAAKIRADLRAKAGTPAFKKTEQENFIEREISDKLLSKAKSGAETIHDHSMAVLKLEIDLADIQLQSALIAEFPFQKRRQQARQFFLTLIQTAGLDVKYQAGDCSFGQTSALSAKLKELKMSFGIIEATVVKFEPIGYSTTSSDAVLNMAAWLPRQDLPQLIECWAESTAIGNIGKVGLTYTRDHSLKWRISKKKTELRGITSHSVLGFDVSGSSDRQRARA